MFINSKDNNIPKWYVWQLKAIMTSLAPYANLQYKFSLLCVYSTNVQYADWVWIIILKNLTAHSLHKMYAQLVYFTKSCI